MSWELVGKVSRRKVGGQSRKLLLMTMADKANDDGSGVYASFSTLAEACEMNRATVKRLIKEFEDEGLVAKVGERECSNGRTNDYTLNVDAIDALPRIAKRTGFTTHPVRQTPGAIAAPGAPDTPTGCVAPPDPVRGAPQTYPKPIQNLIDVDAGTGARARNPAETIVAAVNSPFLDPSKTPDLIQTQTEVARWLIAGADLAEDVIPVVTAIMAKTQKPIRKWGYFTAAVREHAARRLSPVVAIEPAQEPVHAQHQPARRDPRRPRSGADVAIDLAREFAAAERAKGVG